MLLVPASARFAGEYGDGLITAGGEEPDAYQEMLRNFAAGAKEAERIYTPQLSEKNGKIVGADTIREAGCFFRRC